MQYAIAYALSSAAGLRAIFALAVASLAVHAGWFHPPANLAWLDAWPVTIALLVLAALELLADKVPLLDHSLHVAQTVLKPAIAAILVAGALHGLPAPALVSLVVLGALNAFGIHAAAASGRGVSTTFTGGFGNPIVSLFEDMAALAISVLAFLTPWLAAILALVVGAIAVRVLVGVRRTLFAKARANVGD